MRIGSDVCVTVTLVCVLSFAAAVWVAVSAVAGIAAEIKPVLGGSGLMIRSFRPVFSRIQTQQNVRGL